MSLFTTIIMVLFVGALAFQLWNALMDGLNVLTALFTFEILAFAYLVTKMFPGA